MNNDKNPNTADNGVGSTGGSALCAKTKPEKINARLFDLVRYMRAELHKADLITDSEYGWLCSEASLATGAGSPSPRRLENYDELRRRLDALEKPNGPMSQPRAERHTQ